MNQDEDPTYDVDAEALEDQVISLHGKEWVQCLPKDNLMSLTLLLYDLVNRMHAQEMNASELIGELMIGQYKNGGHHFLAIIVPFQIL